MKISMFTNTYLPHVGGVAQSVKTYRDELLDRGFDVTVVAPEFEGAEQSTDSVFRVPAIQNFNGSDFSLRLPQLWRLSEWLDQARPHLIHSHHPFLLGDAALRAACERQLPLVFTHHTMYEQYTHYVPLDSEAMKRMAIQMATEYCNLCDHVIAPSESIAKLLRKRGVTTPVTSIPTGIDLDFFGGGSRQAFREQFQIDHDALVVGHVGRLAAEKNLVFLGKAVAEFLDSNRSAVFLVVGDGPEQEQMASILQEAESRQQVVFAGRQIGDSLRDAYASMDVFAFSSQSETQGMVIAEAMAAGNPVVALDGPGVREIVAEKNGRLLPSDATESDFAAAIRYLATDPERLLKTAREARRSAKPYGLQTCADRLSKLYSTLVADFESKHRDDLTAWEMFQGRLEAEWILLGEKASALAGAAVSDTKATRTTLS